MNGDFFFRLGLILIPCSSFIFFVLEERNEVTCWALFFVGECILVLGASYMLLIWFFFKAKRLGNEKEIPHHRN